MDKIKILIVDDDEDIILMMNDFFETIDGSDQFLISTASTPASATEAIEKNTPHVMLTDMLIPGTDGFKLAEMLNSKNKNAYVIMMSGRNQQTSEPETQNLINTYLKKPFDLDTFEKTILGAIKHFKNFSAKSKG
ncbi:MAG TPA: response regulator [Candidatus Wallbacteria bacterium]|nr:response regulator [Candidatus Wallbacteria bacterium]